MTPAEVEIECADLEAAVTAYARDCGLRLDMIAPADAPRRARLSGDGLVVAIRQRPPEPGTGSALADVAGAGCEAWTEGRAGMRYRDLLPGRLGGHAIASLIRIESGGPVADYVHFHRVAFQAIYCRSGWVRVVYEDQGPPFLLRPGDCVLQPPTIRHRVLEASPGLEVIEIGCPAEHETWRDHDCALPTEHVRPGRRFGGQRFVRHVAAQARWSPAGGGGFQARDTGIGEATSGLAGTRVLRAASDGAVHAWQGEALRRPVFVFCLEGRATLEAGGSPTMLGAGQAACIRPDAGARLVSGSACELLDVVLPPEA